MAKIKKLFLALSIVILFAVLLNFLFSIAIKGIPISSNAIDVTNVTQKGNEITFDITVTQQSSLFACIGGYTFDVDEKKGVIICHVYQKPKFLVKKEYPNKYTISIPKDKNIKAVFYGGEKKGILIWK